MSKAYEFLKECGSFFVLSINADAPAGRPFGAVMEVGDHLYLSTNDMNEAHRQIRANGNIQIVAQRPNSGEWIRITGVATECVDPGLKTKMMDECPNVKQIFDNVGIGHFILLQVKVSNVEFK